jgi:hypothetical protein
MNVDITEARARRPDYCRSERHESASARFDANRHPRNGAESRPYCRTAPAPERAPTKVPDKVPEKVIAPASFDAFFSDQARDMAPRLISSSRV